MPLIIFQKSQPHHSSHSPSIIIIHNHHPNYHHCHKTNFWNTFIQQSLHKQCKHGMDAVLSDYNFQPTPLSSPFAIKTLGAFQTVLNFRCNRFTCLPIYSVCAKGASMQAVYTCTVYCTLYTVQCAVCSHMLLSGTLGFVKQVSHNGLRLSVR